MSNTDNCEVRTPIGQFGLRTSRDVLAWVEEKAKADQRSRNFVINEILKAAMKADQAVA